MAVRGLQPGKRDIEPKLVAWRCCLSANRIRLLNERIEPIQIDRFYQMMMETNLVASSQIFLHAEPGQGDAEHRMIVF